MHQKSREYIAARRALMEAFARLVTQAYCAAEIFNDNEAASIAAFRKATDTLDVLTLELKPKPAQTR